MDKFLGLLNQFYTDTRVHECFQKHQAFYQQKLKALNDMVMPYVRPEWYNAFYGRTSNSLNRVVMGFATNDGGGYGIVRHLMGQPWENCPVLCYYDLEQEELSQEGRNGLATMITGMLNRSSDEQSTAVKNNAALLNEIGNKLLSNNQWLMTSGYYDGQTVMNKSLEEAANIIFMMENGSTPQQVANQLAQNISSGFSWMPELVNALCDYTSHRNKYKTISDFYPKIAKVLNKYIDNEQKRIDKALK
jgi:hypothetical protein